MHRLNILARVTKRTIKILIMTAGFAAVLFVALAFTSLPYWGRYHLGTGFKPDYHRVHTLVILGGGGFPSEKVLMRLWYGREVALQNPGLKIVIATPGSTDDPASTLMKMRHILLEQGIDSTRIILENRGLNTRDQALMVRQLYEDNWFDEPLVIITSPEHIYRSVKCFQKAGFDQVSGQPTLEAMLETDLKLSNRKLGGNQTIPDVGDSIALRYSFWDYMKYEIEVAREYLAITYYRLKGWI